MVETEAKTVGDLVVIWRQRSECLQGWTGSSAQSHVYQIAADELENVLRLAQSESLTLQQAAAESGYSTDHLGRMIREEKIPNAGRKGAPLIRRKDLPRKREGEKAGGARKAPTCYTINGLFRDIADSKQ